MSIQVQFLNPFLSSFINTMETMATMKLVPEKPRLKEGHVALGDVSGLMGMVATEARGSMSITFAEDFALNTMEKMLGERPESINEEVSDMVGEICNIVVGGAKRILSENGFEFDMATPAVVTGKQHSIQHKSKGKIILVPFKSEFGKAYIEICFE